MTIKPINITKALSTANMIMRIKQGWTHCKVYKFMPECHDLIIPDHEDYQSRSLNAMYEEEPSAIIASSLTQIWLASRSHFTIDYNQNYIKINSCQSQHLRMPQPMAQNHQVVCSVHLYLESVFFVFGSRLAGSGGYWTDIPTISPAYCMH
jgi:hypothetical protein